MFVVPDGVSRRIGEILELLANTRVNALTEELRPITPTVVTKARIRACNAVAERRGVKATTVADKYIRRLGLTGTKHFDSLLLGWLNNDNKDDSAELRSVLYAYRPYKYPCLEDEPAIIDFFIDADRVDHQDAVWDESDEATTLDNIVSDGHVLSRLYRLSNAMAVLPPRRIERIVEQTIRRDSDTSLVQALKEACGYRCQFNACDAVIPMRTGGYYVEVAHIKPVREGGRSVLGNLLVLCPNHHKEFDLGEPVIEQQSVERVSGVLNGRQFEIRLPD